MAQAKKPEITLLQLLAIGSTAKSRKLLMKYGETDATSYKDLESKLAELWRKSPDKLAIEKEFVAIHPHKDVILKYTDAPVEAIENLQVMTDTKKDQVTEDTKKETKSGCDGCSGNCGKSSVDGLNPMGTAAASTDNTFAVVAKSNNTRLIVEVAGVIAIVGLLLHYKKI